MTFLEGWLKRHTVLSGLECTGCNPCRYWSGGPRSFSLLQRARYPTARQAFAISARRSRSFGEAGICGYYGRPDGSSGGGGDPATVCDARGLSVGCWPSLEKADIERIAEAVREGIRLLDLGGRR